MLQINSIQPTSPTRVLILGEKGFLARALIGALSGSGIGVLPIGRGEIDLSSADAGPALAKKINPGDSVVFLSAVTPDKGRGTDAFLANVRMGAAVCAAIAASPPAHVVYIGSDAVYPFGAAATNEASCAEPTDLYGAAHIARELMLKSTAKCPLAILRPTMIYGAGDTHNSYGANRFRRTARAEGRITLFGEGEETRDHLLIDDAVALIELTLKHRAAGTLNLVSGHSVSFAGLARMVAGQFPSAIQIASLPRQMPVTHRKFDAANLHAAFPAFRLTPLREGLAKVHASPD